MREALKHPHEFILKQKKAKNNEEKETKILHRKRIANKNKKLSCPDCRVMTQFLNCDREMKNYGTSRLLYDIPSQVLGASNFFPNNFSFLLAILLVLLIIATILLPLIC